MDDALQERVEALERTVADGKFDTELAEQAELEQRLAAAESELETVEEQIDDLEAATQALRGYVGNIRAVNDDVEQRANTALAKAEALEATLDGSERQPDHQQTERSAAQTPTTPTDGNEGKQRDGQPMAGGGQESHSGGQRPATANDGVTEPPDQRANERCHACGRRHGRSESDSKNPPGATDGGSATHAGGQAAENSLVPDDSDETGTLQRIREML